MRLRRERSQVRVYVTRLLGQNLGPRVRCKRIGKTWKTVITLACANVFTARFTVRV